MAAPTPAVGAVPTPAGIRIRNGYRTTVIFNADPTIGLWPITVTPPALSGPPAIDTSTMLNDDWQTFAPGALVRLGEFTYTANYTPAVYDDILTFLNVEGTYTLVFPNGGKLAFYAALINFAPDALANGTLPSATVTMLPTNTDPATGGEEAPVYTPPASAFMRKPKTTNKRKTVSVGYRKTTRPSKTEKKVKEEKAETALAS